MTEEEIEELKAERDAAKAEAAIERGLRRSVERQLSETVKKYLAIVGHAMKHEYSEWLEHDAQMKRIYQLEEALTRISKVGTDRRTGETGYMGEHHATCQQIAIKALEKEDGA